MQVDPARVIDDLRELDRLTGGPEGARRVCWTDVWVQARSFLRERLDAIGGIAVDIDEAGNLWADLPGRGQDDDDERAGAAGGRPHALEGAVAVGSHLDSVPNGGWLDGALGVMAALEVLRVAAADRPERSLTLVDFADEEGARFGRSLFGSSAVSGTLDVAALEPLRDAEGNAPRSVLAEHGVDLDRVGAATSRREPLVAYLELHIEQGPVLERESVAVAAVSGTFGVERHRLLFKGQASHAGTTPMPMRRDAGLAAAQTTLAVEEIARRHDGVGTGGVLRLEPGVPTAVAGRAELVVDLRHAEAEPLAAMLEDTRTAARRAADERDCSVEESEIWHIEPIPFDERLVAAAREAAGSGRVLASGALHDAAEMARHVPVAMVFAPSTAGLSHTKEEDTPEEDLVRAIAAFGQLALGVARGEEL
jgi:N-carbamoyl-L-amino-acid hydrolase